MDEVRVLAPATVSNVVCGFDCLGFALDGPYDDMTVRMASGAGIRIVHHDGFCLPTEAEQNVAGVALQAFIDASGIDHGYEVEITKRIKPGSGIGSSAASACGAVVAANLLAGEPFTKPELIELAMAGEMLAAGSRHADNLAPCIYGGFTLVRSSDPLDIVPLAFPELYATVIHPQIEIRTAEARAILPSEVALADAVRNWSNLGGFIAGLASGDRDLLGRSMVDTIIEPARSSLIPHFDKVKAACLDAGAIGGGISGSGPSMFMLSRDRTAAERVAAAMRSAYLTTGIDFNTYVSPVSNGGVRLAP
ncbi:MAG: homoserine kinase [Chloracidobacterium sp.]|nr:homoserine kinase [Chloracidobacterium sp.]